MNTFDTEVLISVLLCTTFDSNNNNNIIIRSVVQVNVKL